MKIQIDNTNGIYVVEEFDNNVGELINNLTLFYIRNYPLDDDEVLGGEISDDTAREVEEFYGIKLL